MKTCTTCETELPPEQFHVRRASPDGLSLVCKSCDLVAHRKPEVLARKAARQRVYRLTRLEKEVEAGKRWREVHALREAARKKAAYLADPGRVHARNQLRKKHVELRTPPWADRAAIAAVYRRAAEIAELTGEPVHVDHEIPLRGELVSGLHVANNLRIVHATENLKKNNRFEVA